MSDLFTVLCKSCGAEIAFLPTKTGKMPVDAKPVKVVVLVGDHYEVRKGYNPHWASCPNAAAHRRAGEEKP